MFIGILIGIGIVLAIILSGYLFLQYFKDILNALNK